MPKTRFDRYAIPPVDALKGKILERKQALRLTNQALAKKLNSSPQTVARKLAVPTWEWDLQTLTGLCRVLGIGEKEFKENVRF